MSRVIGPNDPNTSIGLGRLRSLNLALRRYEIIQIKTSNAQKSTKEEDALLALFSLVVVPYCPAMS